MILIYSNTGEWGGVDVLIARLAKYLSDRNRAFRILEPAGSRLRTQLPEKFFVDFCQVDGIAQQVTHVLFPSLAKLRDPNVPWHSLAHAYALAWIVHPNDVFRGFFPFSGRAMDLAGYKAVPVLRALFRSHAKTFDAVFKSLVGKRALVTMDGATERSLRYFVPTLADRPPIVPIPAEVSDAVSALEPRQALVVGYLGRMDSMKWTAIEPFIRTQLAALNSKRPVRLVLVAEGNKVPALKRLCRHHRIECTVRGFMPNDEARHWIASNTHVAVAMGTSALDMAGAGHPCVILDPAAGIFTGPQTKFRYVHETSDCTLGEFRDFPGYVTGRHSLGDCLEPQALQAARVMGRQYVAATHSPVACFIALEGALSRSSATMQEIGTLVLRLMASMHKVKKQPLVRAVAGASWQ